MPKRNWLEFHDSSASLRTEETCSVKKNADHQVRVHKTRSGKKGKTVTVIRGLELANNEARQLLKALKSHCGTGGTIKDDCLELQGDQVNAAIDLLKKQGFSPKQSGG